MKILTLTTLFILACGWSSAQSKLAHINSQEVMAAMPEYKLAVEQLKAFEAAGNAELEGMFAEYQKAVQSYQERAGVLSPVVRQIEEEKLIKKQQALQEREETFNLEVEAYSRELNTPIMAKFNAAVKTVSDREKFDYVVDVSLTMIHNGTDMTKMVMDELLKGTTTNPAPTPANN